MPSKLPTVVRAGGCCCATAPNCSCRWPAGFTVTKQDLPTPGYIVVCCGAFEGTPGQTILAVDMSPLNGAISLVRDGPWSVGDPPPSYTSTNGLWKLTPVGFPPAGSYLRGIMPIPGHPTISINVDYQGPLFSGHIVPLIGESYCRDDAVEDGGSGTNVQFTVGNAIYVGFDGFLGSPCPVAESGYPGVLTVTSIYGPVYSLRPICTYLDSAQRYYIQPAIFTPVG